MIDLCLPEMPMYQYQLSTPISPLSCFAPGWVKSGSSCPTCVAVQITSYSKKGRHIGSVTVKFPNLPDVKKFLVM